MSLLKFDKILVIAAHPDDEVLGCGGTMARLVREGCAVSVAILGEGITSRFEKREDANPSAISTLRSCSRKAAEILGISDLYFFDLPDNRFDTVPLLEITRIIEKLIAETSPQAIITQHGGDLNVDHSTVFRATLTATRPVAGAVARAIYAFEVPSSTEWAFQSFSPPFRPNIFVEIGSTLDSKIQAIAKYDSELRAFPHPRSTEALKARAAYWGSVAGLEAAEAFELIRCVYPFD